MFMNFIGVSLIPVVIAAVADMAIGALWYSPYLFGPMWMKEAGIKNFDMKAARKSMAFQAASALVMAFILGYLLKTFNVTTTDAGFELTFLLWLGFVVTTSSMRVIFEKAKFSVYAITISYQLISMIVMTIILTSMK